MAASPVFAAAMGAALGCATRQAAAALVAAVTRMDIAVGTDDDIEKEILGRLAMITPVLAEKVCAGRQQRLPRLSGRARARRNVAEHVELGSGPDKLSEVAEHPQRAQRGNRKKMQEAKHQTMSRDMNYVECGADGDAEKYLPTKGNMITKPHKEQEKDKVLESPTPQSNKAVGLNPQADDRAPVPNHRDSGRLGVALSKAPLAQRDAIATGQLFAFDEMKSKAADLDDHLRTLSGQAAEIKSAVASMERIHTAAIGAQSSQDLGYHLDLYACAITILNCYWNIRKEKDTTAELLDTCYSPVGSIRLQQEKLKVKMVNGTSYT